MNIGWKLSTAAALALSLVLLVALFIIGGQRNEARRDRDAANIKVSVLTADLSTCRGNVSTLEGSLKRQGQSIADAERAAQNERDLGQARITTVQAQNKTLLAEVAKIRALLTGAATPQSCAEGINALRASRR